MRAVGIAATVARARGARGRIPGLVLGMASWLVPVQAAALVVVTQDVSRANATIHLLNLGVPNTIAHGEVDATHTTFSVATFTAATLAGVDIVYLSPAQTGELGLTASEIDALVAFVEDGGRLLIPADNVGAGWYLDFVDLAAAFDVGYTGVAGFETSADVWDFGTPLTSGPGGAVVGFSVGPPHHSGLTASNPDFVAVAGYPTEEIALGYLPPGEERFGDVVFLTDFNTFFDSEIGMLDNLALWRNLFLLPEPSGLASLSAGAALLALLNARRRAR